MIDATLVYDIDFYVYQDILTKKQRNMGTVLLRELEDLMLGLSMLRTARPRTHRSWEAGSTLWVRIAQ